MPATIDYGWLGVGRWIMDGRDEDGSWPTTDRTVVKTLPSLMATTSPEVVATRCHLPGRAVRPAQISVAAVNEAGEDAIRHYRTCLRMKTSSVAIAPCVRCVHAAQPLILDL
ncbi:hypothetical protein ACLOJK_014347 [Asimina triloba]